MDQLVIFIYKEPVNQQVLFVWLDRGTASYYHPYLKRKYSKLSETCAQQKEMQHCLLEKGQHPATAAGKRSLDASLNGKRLLSHYSVIYILYYYIIYTIEVKW